MTVAMATLADMADRTMTVLALTTTIRTTQNYRIPRCFRDFIILLT